MAAHLLPSPLTLRTSRRDREPHEGIAPSTDELIARAIAPLDRARRGLAALVRARRESRAQLTPA